MNAKGTTLAAALADLDHQYPDIRFRIIDEQDQVRRHIRIFIGDDQVRNLAHVLDSNDEVVIAQALSAGAEHHAGSMVFDGCWTTGPAAPIIGPGTFQSSVRKPAGGTDAFSL